MILKILIAGDGGQGVQTIADIICRTAFVKGLEVTHIPNYGLEQRGGASLSFIQISVEKIGYPKFSQADLVVVLSNQGRDRSIQYRRNDTQVIDVKDFKDELENKKINLQNLNIFLLGLMAKIFEEKSVFTTAELYQQVEEKFSKKSNWEEIKEIIKINIK